MQIFKITHPFDGPNPFQISEKPLRSTNYPLCRRAMKIYLSTKYKLVFVRETSLKSVDDPIKATEWEACNNVEIC